jgi:hypothetical protein
MLRKHPNLIEMIDRRDLVSGSPKLELNLHELNLQHKELIRIWAQAREACDIATRMSIAAARTAQSAHAALAQFESELEHFQDQHDLTEMQRFKLITIDPKNDGEERG